MYLVFYCTFHPEFSTVKLSVCSESRTGRDRPFQYFLETFPSNSMNLKSDSSAENVFDSTATQLGPRRIRLVNFIHSNTNDKENNCCQSALKYGFTECVSYNISVYDKDRLFREQHEHIFNLTRGYGPWTWKPFIILDSLLSMKYGDMVMYLDSEFVFIDSPAKYLKMALQRQVLPFATSSVEKHWTKRDTFILMDADYPKYADTTQRAGGVSLFVVSPFAIDLVSEWLHYVQDERIVNDEPNFLGYANYEGFKGNHHDQSVWSILTKKWNIEAELGYPQCIKGL